SDLLQKAGLKSDRVDKSGINRILSGYVINDQQSICSIIKMPQSCYFFYVVEQDSKLKFVQKGRGITTVVPIDEMVTNNNAKQI
ncbi:phage tail protein, partial [Wolbachia endosymbiont of Atemnus politus]